MSGGGGGPGPSIRNEDEPSCADLVITTHIASPVPAVISTLSKGDLLTITVASITGPIQVVTSGGKLAGSVISKDQARLLSCINGGTEYEAEVLSIKGGNCQIQIRST